ncbi:hypothetical protein [Actinokineospora enzanensis]|uniref:hypothetical protein n=1 Tax=Actinokineospora enzanensis TaxID=155975 RepID=UPI0003AB11DB|nr:hypothetical protein [Actinokineospora enzanensis]
MRDYEEVSRAAEAASAVGAEQGVREAVDDLGSLSQDLVPYDTGLLSQSLSKQVTGHGASTVGQVAYDRPPYAEIQHEDETLRHQDGRVAHFLSGPLKVEARRYVNHIARRTGEAINHA